MVVIVAGIACLLLEHYYYQYIDESGVLHESLFMPIGVMLILLGSAAVIFSLAKMSARFKE